MRALWAALSCEILKARRTLALAMTILAPAVIAFLQMALYLQSEGSFATPGENPWPGLGNNTVTFWALLMLPLFVTLETALLSGMEHSQRHWTLLYALPVPRWAYYAAKQLTAMALLALSNVVMLGWVVVVGLLLRWLMPVYGFDAPISLGSTLEALALAYAASLLVVSLQTWVAMRWPSFVVALGVGIAGTVAAALLINDELAAYYPWAIPAVVIVIDPLRTAALTTGLAGGAVVALLGCWHISRRDAI
jgi:hypothetical protein